jgi:hypothetical protein
MVLMVVAMAMAMMMMSMMMVMMMAMTMSEWGKQVATRERESTEGFDFGRE